MDVCHAWDGSLRLGSREHEVGTRSADVVHAGASHWTSLKMKPKGCGQCVWGTLVVKMCEEESGAETQVEIHSVYAGVDMLGKFCWGCGKC